MTTIGKKSRVPRKFKKRIKKSYPHVTPRGLEMCFRWWKYRHLIDSSPPTLMDGDWTYRVADED